MRWSMWASFACPVLSLLYVAVLALTRENCLIHANLGVGLKFDGLACSQRTLLLYGAMFSLLSMTIWTQATN